MPAPVFARCAPARLSDRILHRAEDQVQAEVEDRLELADAQMRHDRAHQRVAVRLVELLEPDRRGIGLLCARADLRQARTGDEAREDPEKPGRLSRAQPGIPEDSQQVFVIREVRVRGEPARRNQQERLWVAQCSSRLEHRGFMPPLRGSWAKFLRNLEDAPAIRTDRRARGDTRRRDCGRARFLRAPTA